MKILIQYAEIALKGKNRPFFESKLVENIKNALLREKVRASIRKERGRIVLEILNKDKKKATSMLGNTFGVKFFSFADEVKREEKSILKKTAEIIAAWKKAGIKKIGLETNRADKTFPLTSIEMNKKIGAIAHKNRIKINFSDPEETIFTVITREKAYLYTKKMPGPGGLPVGTSGKVLCLLSGGIDSAAAAWLMMKRGCRVDFLHFHALRSNKEVLRTKIKTITEKLTSFQNNSKLFIVPYHNYQLSTTGKLPDDLDLVFFKHFMLRFAQKIAYRNGYKAIVLGDSIAQVASQTLDNIAATQHGITMPVLRPLTSYDKQEIVDLAKKIGTYDDSIREYKDCCSIVSRKPDTHVKIEKLAAALKKIKLDRLIDKTKKEMEVVKVK